MVPVMEDAIFRVLNTEDYESLRLSGCGSVMLSDRVTFGILPNSSYLRANLRKGAAANEYSSSPGDSAQIKG